MVIYYDDLMRTGHQFLQRARELFIRISGCRRGSLTSVGQSTSLNGVNAPFQVVLRSVNVFYGFNIWNGTEVKLIAALFSS